MNIFKSQNKLDKIMAQLSDFQAQLTAITTAITAVSAELQTLQANAANSLSAADEATLIGDLQSIATQLQALVPAPAATPTATEPAAPSAN